MTAGDGDLSAALLAVLACPCPQHASVRAVQTADGAAVECVRCETRFPVEDGVPVMLLDAAIAGPKGIGVPMAGD